MWNRRVRIGIVLGALGAAACGDPFGPFSPEVNNIAGSFQFQATGIKALTATKAYSWQNTGTTANVNQSCVFSAGSGTLKVMDAQGATVYSRSLADNGTYATSAGAAGTWTIEVSLSNMSGTLNFRLQTP